MVIRPAVRDDVAAVVDVAVSSGLFAAEDVGIVEDLIETYHDRGRAAGHHCLVVDDGGVRAVAYAEPVRATANTHELTMIAVRRDDQGRGRGGALLERVEHDLRERGGRLLIVLTSGSPGFARTRGFYAARGYEQEARIRDYYDAGEDVVVFRTAL